MSGTPAYQHVPLRLVLPSPFQNRRRRGDDDPRLPDLVSSVRELGVLEPVLVRRRRRGDGYAEPVDWTFPLAARTLDLGAMTIDADEWFELMGGERRCLAAHLAGLTEVPAMVRELVEDPVAAVLVVTENHQRSDLDPLEEADGVATLLAQFGGDHSAVQAQLGMPATWVAQRARLTHLVDSWRVLHRDPASVVSGWSAGHLAVVARLSEVDQESLRHQLRYHMPARPSVAELERLTAAYLRRLSSAPWKLGDGGLVPEAGPCSACPKRTSQEPLLFPVEGDDDTDRCRDGACWRSKFAAHLESLAARLGRGGAVIWARVGWYGNAPDDARPPHADEAVDVHSVRRTKRGEGGVPVIVVDGDRAGSHFFGLLPAPAARRGRAPDPVTGVVATGPLTLEERRARLERRRGRAAVEALAAEVEEMRSGGDDPPPLRELTVLAATFGTRGNFAGWGDYYSYPGGDDPLPPDAVAEARTNAGDGCPALWARFDVLLGQEDDLLLRRALWSALSPVLLKRLQYDASQPMPRMLHEATRLAELVGVDFSAIRARIAESLPEPRSWATLPKEVTTPRPTDLVDLEPLVPVGVETLLDDAADCDIPT